MPNQVAASGTTAASSMPTDSSNGTPAIAPRPEASRSDPEAQQHQQKQQQQPRHGPRPSPRPRPNYFLSLRVSHLPSVLTAATTVQQALTHHNPALGRACVDVASLHLTLGVMALHTPECVEAAAAALTALPTVLKEKGLAGPVSLRLAGLGHFRSQVGGHHVNPELHSS